MFKKRSRFFSIVLSICMLVTVSPFAADGWNGSGSVSAASVKPAKTITYKCTGNQANDIVGIARTQKGYMPYTEFSNAYSQFWGYQTHWCAEYVCWCAWQAGMKDFGKEGNRYSKKRKSTYAVTASPAYFKGMRFNRGKKEPQKGDLVFFLWDKDRGRYSYSHIEIVSGTSKNKVTTIGGNTGAGAGKVAERTWDKTERQIVCYVRPNYKNNAVATHTITMNMNGGTGNTSKQAVKDGGTFTLPAKPTRTGYTFTGYYANRRADCTWHVNNHGWMTWDQIQKKKLTSSISLYKPGKRILDKSWTKKCNTSGCTRCGKSDYQFKAQWKANTFTVRYDASGGTGAMADVKHTYGVKKNLTKNQFRRDGYTFAGYWYVYRKSDGKWAYTKDGKDLWCARDRQPAGYTLKKYGDGGWIAYTSPVNNDIVTLYAQWTANTFNAKYNGNGGTGIMADFRHTYGVKKNLNPNQFSRDGYTFAGWNIYRVSDQKWMYGNGNQTGWYVEGKQPSGYELWNYADQTPIAWTTPVQNDTIILYATWDPVKEPDPIEDFEIDEPEDDMIDDDDEEFIDDEEFADDDEEFIDDNASTDELSPEPELSYDWTAWSGYSTTKPAEQDNRQIEARTEYRYRDKRTVKSGKDTLSGYTKESTQTRGPSYGKWLPGELKPYTSVTDEKKTVVTVEKKTVNLSVAHYCKCKKVCWRNSGGSCKYCGGKTNYGKLRIYSSKSLAASGYKKDTDGSYFLPTTVKKASPGKLGEIYCMKFGDSHIDSFTTGSTVGNKNTFVWPSGTATLYRNKYVDYINTFSKWGNWSNWSGSAVNASGARQVETRTVYRYRDWVEQ